MAACGVARFRLKEVAGLQHYRDWPPGTCCATTAQHSQLERQMPTGTVKFYNSAKGYGFIQPDEGGVDVFVHVSSVEQAGMRALAEGQKISFDVEADRRTGKSRAVNIREE
jgi:cold shock protein